mmetsp:Transcript_30403/g.29301  ORF Transcript_30403/g.29301 Transcript_30403/m.29301 type:complete len:411 (-) Transcript_30403:147-1379(-)
MLFSKIQAITALFFSNLYFYVDAADPCQATCVGNECTFKVTVNLYSGETGYYEFEGCEGSSPTLGIEIGKTYKFDQGDLSNYYHPLGLAYWPDGALNTDETKQMELETVNVPVGSSSLCADDSTCPSPKYYLDDTYLGSDTDLSDFGLDVYEPKFKHPISEWVEDGKFSVKLTFDDDEYKNRDFFYFCHIHHGMSGRFKLIDSDGKALYAADTPDLGYDYQVPGAFDTECGTYGLDNFQLPHGECPSQFVCGKDTVSAPVKAFSTCIEAMDCHMMVGMTSNVMSNGSDKDSMMALFIHQMIPHHQNAVNMAKALLFKKQLKCVEGVESDDCELDYILRDIVNVQNAQIQTMKNILTNQKYKQEDDCNVPIRASRSAADTSPSTSQSYKNKPLVAIFGYTLVSVLSAIFIF